MLSSAFKENYGDVVKLLDNTLYSYFQGMARCDGGSGIEVTKGGIYFLLTFIGT